MVGKKKNKSGFGGRREEKRERDNAKRKKKKKTHFSSSIKAKCILGLVSRQLYNGNILESFLKKDLKLRVSKGQKVIIK